MQEPCLILGNGGRGGMKAGEGVSGFFSVMMEALTGVLNFSSVRILFCAAVAMGSKPW